MTRRLLLAGVFALVGACASQGPERDTAHNGAQPTDARQKNAQQTLVRQAAALVNDGKQEEALTCLDAAIAGYEERYAKETRKVYSARTLTETLLYLASAAKDKADAVAVEPEYGYAYYLKAYVLIDLGRNADAEAPLAKAVALAPWNAQFLAELGNAYKSARDWPQALATYRKAEAASEFSPNEVRDSERARAWRGIGFVEIELGDLDEAQAMFERCIALDPHDKRALNEMAYLRQQRNKRSGH